MGGRWDNLARGIRSFVKHPVTILVKGLALVVIGISETSHTFRDDFAHGHVRLGHGLIIIGLFGILEALPNLIEGLEAWARFVEARQEGDAGD